MNTAITVRPDNRRALEMLFIIGAPVLSFVLITLVSMPRAVTGSFLYDSSTPDWFIAFSAIMTHTHVMMVFYRSHLNGNIFRKFPMRFTIVPIIVLCGFYISTAFVGIMAVVAFYWDEWHSILQTFGFGRIYDVRNGNDPHQGRRLDIGISFVLCLFPHLIMLTYLPDNQRIEGISEVLILGATQTQILNQWIESLRYPLIIFGSVYIVYYVMSYRELMKNGYRISRAKIALLGTTCLTAILIALFYSIADAAHYFNIYHALQYIFIVFISEAPSLSERFQHPRINKKAMMICCGIMMLTIGLALGIARNIDTFTFMGNFWLLSSLLHFWYDGFIWSVRKNDIA